MTRNNVRKVLGQTAQLAHICGKQNLFHSFHVVGTTKSSSSNNNYSTKAKKENFINIPKQLNNNKLFNIFVTGFKNYSSSVNSNNNTIQVLNPVQYKTWSKDEVCSLLCSPEENGGAGLTVEKVKPLYDAGFDGTSLGNIVTLIQKKDEFFAFGDTRDSFPTIAPDTLKTVVFWVDNLLKTRLYHLWSVEQLEKHLCRPITSGGAGLEKTELNDAVNHIQQPKTIINMEIADKLESWKEILTIKNISIPKEFEKISWDILKRELLVNDVESNRRIDTIVEIIGPQNIKNISHTLIIKQKLEPLCNALEDSVAIFKEAEYNSIETFNRLVKPFGLDNPKSEIYIYTKDVYKEASKSCQLTSLDFGPTFPENKYEERVQFLNSSHAIAVFFEPPGTGKTHFAFYLTKENKHLVIPIDEVVCAKIIDELYRISSRNEMDKIVKSFSSYYSKLVIFLTGYCKRIPNLDSKNIHQYILRFLWNGSRDTISQTWLFEEEIVSLLKDVSNSAKIVWFLDEAHNLGQCLADTVPRNSPDQKKGNLITLLCHSLRSTGSMVLTTTFASFIEGNIEAKISTDQNKIPLERFSHQFVNELPVLQAKDVEHFLNYFINTKSVKVEEHGIWNLVSCFIQGTFRTSNIFLENLYIHLTGSDPRVARHANCYTQLIFNALSTTMIQRKDLKFSSLKEKFSIPKYKTVFHKLAIFGEAKLEDPGGFAMDFLMKIGISCTYNYENNLKVFKLVSPLEKMRILESLIDYYGEKDWLEKTCEYLKSSGNLSFTEMGTLCEVTYAHLISRHFDDIKQIFKGTELEKYNLKATYHFEDSVISIRSSSDIKLSTIMLNTLHRNRFGMSVENNPYPLANETFGIQSYFSFPCEEARAEFIAILILDDKYKPSATLPHCIPLVAAVSRATDYKKAELDFLTTDLTKFYTENIEKPIPNKPSSAEKLKEYAKVKDLNSSLVNGMMLRILIHPNMSHHKPLSKRKYKNLQASKVISFDAIKNKKGHFILDLHAGSTLIQEIEKKQTFRFPNQ